MHLLGSQLLLHSIQTNREGGALLVMSLTYQPRI